jgi:hypothetical protein
MIVTFVTFDADDLDEARVHMIAAEARGMFEHMPNLRTKLFTLAETKQRATNVYVWESEAAARDFFTVELIERVTGLYGARPRIEFAEIIALVDNTSAQARAASHAD